MGVVLKPAGLEGEAVVGEADVGGELGVGLVIVEVVGDVGQPGAFGFELVDDLKGLIDAEVGGVGFVAKGIDDEVVKAGELGQCFVGNVADIGAEGKVADAKAEGGEVAVKESQAGDGHAKDIDGPGRESFEFEAWGGAVVGGGILWLEGVGESLGEDF